MKTILALAIAIITFSAAPATTKACDNYTYRPASYCAPVLVCTKELCRHTECRWAVNSCGHRYSYEVVIVTFGDYYSDGSVERYTRTFRA